VRPSSVIGASLQVLDPQAQGVPQAAEPAGLGHFVDGHQRVFADRLVAQGQLQGADLLALGDRRQQGCWLTTLAFSLSASPLGTDSTKSFRKPALTVFSLPFQTRGSLTAWLALYTLTVS
jgi:hypothetical protein